MWTPSFLHARQVKVRAALKGHTEAELPSTERVSVLSASGLHGDFKTVVSLKDAFRLLGPRPSGQNSWAHSLFPVGKDPCFGKLTQETSYAQGFSRRTEATESQAVLYRNFCFRLHPPRKVWRGSGGGGKG